MLELSMPKIRFNALIHFSVHEERKVTINTRVVQDK
jgi:hypothetical protein